MAGTEGPGRALAVHEEPAFATVDLVLFDLACVVGDIEQEFQFGAGQHLFEHLSRQMGEDLAVGERAVDGRAHGAQIGLAGLGVDRGAGEFPIGQRNPVLWGSDRHLAQKLGADLVAQAARAAMDADHHIVPAEPEGLGDLGVEDFHDLLELEVMVARAERPDLLVLALLGLVGHAFGPGPGHHAPLLDTVQVGRLAIAALDRPPGAAAQHLVHLFVVQAQLPGAAHAGGYGLEQGVGQPRLDRLGFGSFKAGKQVADAAGDVEADAAGRDDAAGLGVERGDAADRKTVAPMGVGHGIGGLDDAGEAGDVGRLLQDLVVHVLDELGAGEDHRGHAHPAFGRKHPFEIGLPRQSAGVHPFLHSGSAVHAGSGRDGRAVARRPGERLDRSNRSTGYVRPIVTCINSIYPAPATDGSPRSATRRQCTGRSRRRFRPGTR